MGILQFIGGLYSCGLILGLTDLYSGKNDDRPFVELSWIFVKFNIHNLDVFTDITASIHVLFVGQLNLGYSEVTV